MSDTVPTSAGCPECRDVGWLLNEYHSGDGPNDPSLPLSLDLLPCIYPTCEASRNRRPIATLGIREQFATVIRHPRSGAVMALTGFLRTVYR